MTDDSDPTNHLQELKDATTSEALTTAWRQARSALHPDHGGDAALFDACRKLYDKRLPRLEAADRVCPGCEGTGHTLKPGGFGGLRQMCRACGGTGERRPEA